MARQTAANALIVGKILLDASIVQSQVGEVGSQTLLGTLDEGKYPFSEVIDHSRGRISRSERRDS
jgi:hypothetical protein